MKQEPLLRGVLLVVVGTSSRAVLSCPDFLL